jgi:flagellar biosynthetic protein FliQ
MDATLLVESLRQATLAGAVVALPVLVTGLVVGLVTGLLQAATGVHEPIVGLVPRLAAMAAVVVLTLPWMVERLADLVRLAAAP